MTDIECLTFIRKQYGSLLHLCALAWGHRTEVLAGIMCRETRGGTSPLLDVQGPAGRGDGGHGHGLMQIDDRSFPDFCRSVQWSDARLNIDFGARVLIREADVSRASRPASSPRRRQSRTGICCRLQLRAGKCRSGARRRAADRSLHGAPGLQRQGAALRRHLSDAAARGRPTRAVANAGQAGRVGRIPVCHIRFIQEETDVKIPWFVSLKHANWTRFAWIIGGIVAVWATMAAVLPPKIYTVVSVVLSATQTALTYFMRPSTYVEDRQDNGVV